MLLLLLSFFLLLCPTFVAVLTRNQTFRTIKYSTTRRMRRYVCMCVWRVQKPRAGVTCLQRARSSTGKVSIVQLRTLPLSFSLLPRFAWKSTHCTPPISPNQTTPFFSSFFLSGRERSLFTLYLQCSGRESERAHAVMNIDDVRARKEVSQRLESDRYSCSILYRTQKRFFFLLFTTSSRLFCLSVCRSDSIISCIVAANEYANQHYWASMRLRNID